MTLILVEGLDRAGKTTRCRELMAEKRERKRVMLHFVAPPKGQASLVYDEMLYAYSLAGKNPDVDFVLDRGHVSWFAYEELMRGNRFEDAQRQLFELTELYWPLLDRRIEYVECSADILQRRDDGLSTYSAANGNADATIARILREQEVFERVVSASKWPVARRRTA